MKLAEETHLQLELFFREYFGDEKFILPEINIYCGKFTGIFINIIKVHGITLGRRIYIWPELITCDSNNKHRISRNLVSHEIAHVLQFRKHGYMSFFYNYLKNYWLNLRRRQKWDLKSRQEAYLEIPFEIEARQTADNFVEWSNIKTRAEKNRVGDPLNLAQIEISD